MALTTAGIKYLAEATVGQAVAFDSTNAHIGVGNSANAFMASQTNLQGTSTFRKAMDSGYPTVAAPVVTFKSTFAPSEANFSWNEWGIFNASTGGVMLNRVVESNGTKLSNQTWVLEVAITFSIGT